jgi:hypothetical protein
LEFFLEPIVTVEKRNMKFHLNLIAFFYLVIWLAAPGIIYADIITFYTDRALFNSAVASSTTVNFEGLVSDTSHFTQNTPLTINNVVFSVSSGFIGVAGKNVSSGDVLGAPFNSAILFSNNSLPLTANITGAGSGFTAVGGTFGNVTSSGVPATLTLLGSGGLLDVRNITTGDMGLGMPATFFGWTVHGDSIQSVTYSLQNGHPNYDAMDDFVFGFATVPEPSALQPLLALLFSLPVYHWRRLANWTHTSSKT